VNRSPAEEVFLIVRKAFSNSLAAATSTAATVPLGVTSLALGGFADLANYGAIWSTWWLGDTTGDLVFAPLIILWSVASKRRWNSREAIEVGVLLVLLFALSELVFGGWVIISARNYPIAFICGPVVIWMAFRFTQRETAIGIFILSAIAILGTPVVSPFVGKLKSIASRPAVLDSRIRPRWRFGWYGERRRVEEELHQQKAIVEAANRTKDHFLAMLSHELRTPLTPVISALEALETEPAQTGDAKTALAMIRRNIELETQLIDDLLDFTRIAKDKLQLRFAPVDAHLAISNVVEICRVEAKSKNLRGILICARTALRGCGRGEVQQIIWNLLKNATVHAGRRRFPSRLQIQRRKF
jgi:signal transduction histidine kinase